MHHENQPQQLHVFQHSSRLHMLHTSFFVALVLRGSWIMDLRVAEAGLHATDPAHSRRLECRAQKISALRASAAHANDDIGVSVAGGRSTVVNADENSIIWGRTPAQVCRIQ